MKQRAQISGLNPDRADSVIGGAAVLLEVMSAHGVDGIVVSSRGVREGLALGGPDASIPPARWVRTISVATLSARFATWDMLAAERRTTVATRLHDALDPESRDVVREMLIHASNILDVGRAIDYYDRFEHAAMIVTSADLGRVHARDARHPVGDPPSGRRRHPPRPVPAPDRRRRPLRGASSRHRAGARRRVEAADPARAARDHLVHVAPGRVRRRRSVPSRMAAARRGRSVPAGVRATPSRAQQPLRLG